MQHDLLQLEVSEPLFQEFLAADPSNLSVVFKINKHRIKLKADIKVLAFQKTDDHKVQDNVV